MKKKGGGRKVVKETKSRDRKLSEKGSINKFGEKKKRGRKKKKKRTSN